MTDMKYPRLFPRVCKGCGKSYSTFFETPHKCAYCHKNCEVHRLDGPITNSGDMKYSIVIKPTFGTFQNYSRTCLLHVGISNSKGCVYHFNRTIKSDKFWTECIGTRLFTDGDVPQNFDSLLRKFYTDEIDRTRIVKYHSRDNNCFDFGIRFLNFIEYKGRDNSRSPSSMRQKTQFAKDFMQNGVVELEFYLNMKKKRLRTMCDGCGIECMPGNRMRCLECEDLDMCKKCVRSGKTPENHKNHHQFE